MKNKLHIILHLGLCLGIFLGLPDVPSASERSLVYVAGPLFNKHEKLAQKEITDILENHGFKTFLPQRDGFEGIKIRATLKSLLNVSDVEVTALIDDVVYSLDVYQVVERCGSYVGDMNGAVMDDGTVAELTYAAMAGHPVVFYRDDSRSEFDGSMNPLVTQGANTIVDKIEDIPVALKKLNKELPEFQVCLPPTIQKKIKRGKTLWHALEQIKAQFPDSDDRNLKIAEQIKIIFTH